MLKMFFRLLVCLSVFFSFACCKFDNSSELNNKTPVLKSASLQNNVTNKDVIVDVMDVGKADSTLIQIGDKNYLIDAGLQENSKALIKHLHNLGVKELEIVFMTHPHKDHIGGLPAILNSFRVKQIYDTELINPNSKLYPKILGLITQKNIKKSKIQAPMKIMLDKGAYMEVLWPLERKITLANATSNINPNSLVLHLVYKDFSMMFAADIYKQSEEQIIRLYPSKQLSSNVLKVGHHGSDSSTSDEWLNVLKPQVAVASYGIKKGAFAAKYPSDKTLERLKTRQIKLYGTFLDGDVIITTDGEAYSVKVGENRR